MSTHGGIYGSLLHGTLTAESWIPGSQRAFVDDRRIRYSLSLRSQTVTGKKTAILRPGKTTGARATGRRSRPSVRRQRSQWELISDDEASAATKLDWSFGFPETGISECVIVRTSERVTRSMASSQGGDEVAIERVKEKLKGRFEMKDLGEAENILGIRIQRHKGKLMIDQSQFAKEIVAEFLYDDSMKHATPMEPGAIRKLVEEPGRPLNHDEWLKYVELLES
ncbi:reverse transcriptase (RNA-dependent DNA polymerase) [Hirsutella rhossiliensis]|uniref:Reverse transcriptase (RNA-dependent DNA polymerase) domain-containing protein n=1 Tax=Hirsutella rhossiliensis TaxID=111463 RepID=A0A9P8N7S8_9HYPO|nr:reverse transcriptase (RNA-dependent DNA polymerase) domain-containing protein [Hirsutella rhossiliensis]KAH0968122.1 reverse transcriptase (RNA-dependent DNA polymerase) domain-containing protein [Hirsutella rhossiliensis]